MGGGLLLSAHFTDEDIEAQEVMWTAQDMRVQGQRQDLNWSIGLQSLSTTSGLQTAPPQPPVPWRPQAVEDRPLNP